MEKRKIELAAQDRSELLLEHVDRVLAKMGYDPREVLVTDESVIGDFKPFSSFGEPNEVLRTKQNDMWLTVLRLRLENPGITYSDYIVDVAEQLKELDEEYERVMEE